jgi:hypothetical protein
MAGGPTRMDTFAVNVQVEDVGHPARIMLNCGIWDKKTGGEVDSEESKYPPGGMQTQVSLGGRKNVGNVTVSRLYRLVRDHQDLMQRLIDGAGKARMVVAQQPLDIDGNVFGRPLVTKGTLKRVTPPEVDSESSDAAMVELEMTVEGEPVVG